MVLGDVLFLESAQTQKCFRVGFVAAEAFEENHGVFSVARFKNVLLEAGRSLLVKDSFLLEEFPCVGLKNLGPQIGVVTRRVAVVAENVLEVG